MRALVAERGGSGAPGAPGALKLPATSATRGRPDSCLPLIGSAGTESSCRTKGVARTLRRTLLHRASATFGGASSQSYDGTSPDASPRALSSLLIAVGDLRR